jgi:hypothetical protein
MNKLLTLAIGVLLLVGPQLAAAGTLFTNPVIYVTPMVLDFGRMASNKTATATFIVQNAGSGKLVGKATVPAPFKIVSGGTYSLVADEVQIVTLSYKPSGAPTDKQTVKFTGGGEAKATVIGGLPRPLEVKPKQH